LSALYLSRNETEAEMECQHCATFKKDKRRPVRNDVSAIYNRWNGHPCENKGRVWRRGTSGRSMSECALPHNVVAFPSVSRIWKCHSHTLPLGDSSGLQNGTRSDDSKTPLACIELKEPMLAARCLLRSAGERNNPFESRSPNPSIVAEVSS
jgi:hypothetical protein